jgi:hypothetical protein
MVTRNLLHELVLLHVGRRWVEQQVLRLDVAMDLVVLAQILEGAGDLFKDWRARTSCRPPLVALWYLSMTSRVSGSPAMRALPFMNAARSDIYQYSITRGMCCGALRHHGSRRLEMGS